MSTTLTSGAVIKKIMKYLFKEIKTLWAGRAWVHAKYLNEAKNKNVPLCLVYKTDTMTIMPADLKTTFPPERCKVVEDKFKAGVTHKQYGCVWKADAVAVQLPQ